MGLLFTALIGLGAGTLAKKIKPGDFYEPHGHFRTALLGIAGAFVGNIILKAIGLTTSGLFGEIIAATVGALAILYAYQMYMEKKHQNSNKYSN